VSHQSKDRHGHSIRNHDDRQVCDRFGITGRSDGNHHRYVKALRRVRKKRFFIGPFLQKFPLWQESAVSLPRSKLSIINAFSAGSPTGFNIQIGGDAWIFLRIFIKFLFAEISAKGIFLVFIGACESDILFVNYGKTDRIGSHHSSPDNVLSLQVFKNSAEHSLELPVIFWFSWPFLHPQNDQRSMDRNSNYALNWFGCHISSLRISPAPRVCPSER